MSTPHILLFFAPFAAGWACAEFARSLQSRRARRDVPLASRRVRTPPARGALRAGRSDFLPADLPRAPIAKWTRATAERFLAGGSVRWK